MKRKLAFACALLIAMSGLNTACSASGSPKESQGEKKVTLTLYNYSQGSQDWMNFFKNTVIGKFEQQHPNITINLTLNNNAVELERQQLVAGAGPDIIKVNGPSTLQLFASGNYLQPMDAYAKKYGWDNKFSEWAYNTCKKDGKLYGLPDSVDALMVYYNKTMFQKNNWSIPKNQNEFLSLCKSVSSANLTPFAFGCSDYKQANEWWISMGFNAALGNDGMKSVLKGEKTWTDSSVKDAVQKLANLWGKGYIYKNSSSITEQDSRNLFLNGQAAMEMSGEWEVSHIISAKPSFEWGVFEMPSWKDGTDASLPVAIGEAYGINKNCKNPDAVAEFLNWYYGDEVTQGFTKLGQIQPLKNLDSSKIKGIDAHVTEISNLINPAFAANKVGYCSWTYWSPNLETAAWTNWESVVLSQMSTDDYLKDLQNNYNKDKTKGTLFKWDS
jgi:raffinose/stachyose/melibiose transport system substrate-binding protein